jgi:uncharacterized protein YjgD (DUF1641 family)
MAKPILMDLPPRDPRIELRNRLETAPVEHAEALLSAYEVLQGLHDKGVLEIARGLLGSSDEVLEIAVSVANSPESIRGLRNLVLVLNMLGAIEPEELAAFTRSVPVALQAITRQEKPPSLWKLAITFLRDQNIRRGLSASVIFLQTLGGSLAREKRSS